jgi:diguanylate cyclase (GGDEF)-like protein/PAS domain S-box-containing protein
LGTQWILFAGVLILNAIIAITIVVLLGFKIHAPGRNAMIWMLTALAVWAICYAMTALFPSFETKMIWLKLENIGILTVPVFWFLFTVQYAQVDRWLNRLTGSLFFVIPLVSLAFLFSDRWFNFYYAAVHPLSASGGPLVIERGPWYLVAAIQSYLLNVAGMGILIWRFFYHQSIYRKQLTILISAVLIPLVINVFYQFAPRILPSLSIPIDLTPISFTVTAVLLSAGIFGLRLFNLIPIARHTVLEHLPEMIFVVDRHDQLLDANSAAQRMLGKSLDEIVGKDPLEVFRAWPQLINRFLTTDETHEEIQIPGDPSRTLEIKIAPLYDQFNKLEGRLIVAQDITDRKRLENETKRAYEALTNEMAENEKLRAELQEQAIRDPLTNIFNRRYMAEFLDKEIARAERENTPVSVVIMDLDNFKAFNDAYGHKCGDVILRAFADFLVEHTRRGDVVCRFGGEEFVILMPNAPLKIGQERAETWRQDFSETQIDYEGMKFCITFSAGVASFPSHGSTGDAVLHAADQALYRSKNNGRNRVTVFSNNPRGFHAN